MQALRSRRVSSPRSIRKLSSHTGQTGQTHWSDQPDAAAPPSSVLALWINQGTQWFSGEPLETPWTRCSLCQSLLMTRLPRSPDSTLVLRLNQETVHEFVLLFLPPCGPNMNPLATGSLEPSLLVFSTLGGLTGNDLSHLLFTCTNTSQAVTYTCNTYPRVSPHYVVNHSSHQEVTIHWSSNHIGPQSPPWWVYWQHTHFGNQRERKKETTKRNWNKWSKANQRQKNKVTWKRKTRSP
jgi:hypothetical protein